MKPKSYAIVTALLYEFNNKSLFSSLDISSIEQIKKYINDAENEQRAINYIFEKASDSCENNAFDVKKNFVKKLNEYKKIIKLHIEKLKGHLSKVEKLQALVQQNAQFILSTLQGIKSDYPDLYTQLIDWEKKAKEIKNTSLSSYPFNKVVECQQKIEDLKNGIYSGLLEAIQDLENNLEILIKNLNFTRSEKNINYLGDAEIKKDAIYDAFLSLFSERYGNNEKFYESLFQIQRYLEILNERLSKIKELQGLGKPNTKLILSTLPQTKKLEDSIVLIRSAKRANVIGTGFIFYKQENYTYLLTCAHVVEDVGGEENIRVNNIPAEVIKIGDVQGFDLAVLKVNKTFSAPSLNLMILYGEEEKKLKVKIPGYYFFSQNHALRHETIKGEMVVEVDGERAFQLIENIPEYVAVEKLQMEKGSLRSGYSGSPVIDINTGLVLGLVTHKVDVDGEGRFGRAISIEALEKIWTEIPNEVSKQIKRESRESDKGELFTFEVVKVNDSGSIINRSQGSARQKIEDLGNGIKLEMVYIPEGSFLMGSPESEEDRNDSESPQHDVTVSAFFMGKYPVTQGQWKAIASRTDLKVILYLDPDPSHFKEPYQNIDRWRRPVEDVSWYQAVEFCARLSKLTGRNYRLPSEAEWEYACRAGTTTPFYFGETINTDLANYSGTDYEKWSGSYGKGPKGVYREQTTPVGEFPANAFGLYDMHGNIWEWCADEWHDNYNGAPIDGSIWLNGNQDGSPLRGGSWVNYPNTCRSAIRNYYVRRDDYDDPSGFRVVCDGRRTL
ncbi:MAG: SUMF1/EgtB/PvdO family nonheme iron enzyme [Trichodesmium sp. St16_bin2-tuft]|nr:SUMF1/EgtB/PvdO family nonheme iron enzyme [Trichodesmium sp. St16_bin2-tuft]